MSCTVRPSPSSTGGLMSRLKVATALLALLVCGGCARLGFSNRVVHRVPSPDGQFLAVCQEVPAFDGPDYTVRLERPDGSRSEERRVGKEGRSRWSPNMEK